jgi:hypothetical protein
MAALSDKKVVGAPFGNAVELVRVEYNFANDTGAIADYDVMEADGNIVVRLEYMKGIVLCDSAADGTVMDLGKGAGGTEFKSDVAEATLAADALVLSDTANIAVELTDGEKIVLGIETEALTSGQFEMVFSVYAK